MPIFLSIAIVNKDVRIDLHQGPGYVPRSGGGRSNSETVIGAFIQEPYHSTGEPRLGGPCSLLKSGMFCRT